MSTDLSLHHRRRAPLPVELAAIPWLDALPFVLGALAGMLAGRRLAPRIGGPRLQQGFSLVMLLVALGMGAHALKLV